jgi:hypothetical protein
VDESNVLLCEPKVANEEANGSLALLLRVDSPTADGDPRAALWEMQTFVAFFGACLHEVLARVSPIWIMPADGASLERL